MTMNVMLRVLGIGPEVIGGALNFRVCIAREVAECIFLA
jgi:hypothetical protein